MKFRFKSDKERLMDTLNEVYETRNLDKNTKEFDKFVQREVKRYERLKAETKKYFDKNKVQLVEHLLQTDDDFKAKYGKEKYNDLTKEERRSANAKARFYFKRVMEQTNAGELLNSTDRNLKSKLTPTEIVRKTARKQSFLDTEERLSYDIISRIKLDDKLFEKFNEKFDEKTRLKSKRSLKYDSLHYQRGFHYKIGMETQKYREYTYIDKKGNELIILLSDYDKGEGGDIKFYTQDELDKMVSEGTIKYVENKKR